MTYFDAIATGRFKKVGDGWVFHPWAQTFGYALRTPEDHWLIHAWVTRSLKRWVLIGAGVWVLVGAPFAVVVGLGFLTWIRSRSATMCRGYTLIWQPLTLGESYRARAEVHSWGSLWALAAGRLGMAGLATVAAVLEPTVRASAVAIAVPFTLSLISSGFLLYCKAT